MVVVVLAVVIVWIALSVGAIALAGAAARGDRIDFESDPRQGPRHTGPAWRSNVRRKRREPQQNAAPAAEYRGEDAPG